MSHTEASESGGVKVFKIQGRLYRERERLLGMTPEEKCWRIQWLKDQHLHHEPVHVPELYRHHNHIIRRIYRFPLDVLYLGLKPLLGANRAATIRSAIGKCCLVTAGIYLGAYYFKYNQNTWVRKNGIRVLLKRSVVVPGDPGYPAGPTRFTGADYATRGFKNSPI